MGSTAVRLVATNVHKGLRVYGRETLMDQRQYNDLVRSLALITVAITPGTDLNRKLHEYLESPVLREIIAKARDGVMSDSTASAGERPPKAGGDLTAGQ